MENTTKNKAWIQSDERQWKLMESRYIPPGVYKGRESEGGDRESILGYYPKFSQAVGALFEWTCREHNIVGLEDVRAIIDSAKSEIVEMAKTGTLIKTTKG